MPPAFEPAALEWLARSGVMHLLTDLPSVDPEHDGGRLLAHRAFWFPEGRCRRQATITEMIDAQSSLPDGFYALNLMVPRWSLDAAPSRPVIYALHSA
jgi:kynurenine formamidase